MGSVDEQMPWPLIRSALSSVSALAVIPLQDVLALDEALNALAEIDEQRAKVVELRFFSGMTIKEEDK